MNFFIYFSLLLFLLLRALQCVSIFLFHLHNSFLQFSLTLVHLASSSSKRQPLHLLRFLRLPFFPPLWLFWLPALRKGNRSTYFAFWGCLFVLHFGSSGFQLFKKATASPTSPSEVAFFPSTLALLASSSSKKQPLHLLRLLRLPFCLSLWRYQLPSLQKGNRSIKLMN